MSVATDETVQLAFAQHVWQHGLADKFGLTRVRRDPPLPAGHVYLETEGTDRTLRVSVVPGKPYPDAINSAWHVEARGGYPAQLVAVQPCVHREAPGKDEGPVPDPEAHADFLQGFLEILKLHGAERDFGLARVHRHFGMTDDEALLEAPVDQTTTTLRVVQRTAIGEAEPMVWHVQDSPRGPALQVVQYLVATTPAPT